MEHDKEDDTMTEDKEDLTPEEYEVSFTISRTIKAQNATDAEHAARSLAGGFREDAATKEWEVDDDSILVYTEEEKEELTKVAQMAKGELTPEHAAEILGIDYKNPEELSQRISLANEPDVQELEEGGSGRSSTRIDR